MRTHTETHRKRPGVVFRFIGMILGGAVLMGIFAFLFGYFVMLLWNWLMPEIFGLGLITYWQAFGIIILAKLLFGAFNKGYKESKKEEEKGKVHFKNWIYNGTTPWKTHKEEKKDKCSKWQHYECFWEEEGENAFNEYVKRKDNDTDNEM